MCSSYSGHCKYKCKYTVLVYVQVILVVDVYRKQLDMNMVYTLLVRYVQYRQ